MLFGFLEFSEETDAQLELDVEIFSGATSIEPCEGSGDLNCETNNPLDYDIVDENFSKVQKDLLTQGTSNCILLLNVIFHFPIGKKYFLK